MHLIDEVNLKATTGRRILHVIENFAGIFNLGTRGGIHFDQINKATLTDFLAAVTFATWLRGNTLLTVQTLGQNTGDGGFTHPPCTGEQIRMVQALIIKGVDKGAHDMLLPYHVLEKLWTPFTRQYLITHEIFLSLAWPNSLIYRENNRHR